MDGAHERDAAREAAAICLDLPAVAALVLRVEPARFLMKTFVECAGARSCFVERTANSGQVATRLSAPTFVICFWNHVTCNMRTHISINLLLVRKN